ncbi:MAG: tRNA lysidine(34) synthetase TilS [Rhodobiaceae bacterium]|nr:tRNA lysidine(34) synthetase TilS [Rhodobiaceae bacterium]MBT5519045.1 tRNA lysidine(34) synthetase TilS [Rhodobiaceae bacterium]MBT7280675.1 tRNA lysidine(34) synthetase TilS [Rhodobiaceae bacterium]
MAPRTAAGFLKTLSRLKAGAHVALGVSGGGDSLGLLALAAKAQNLKKAPQFSVLTVDHGLRPEARAEAKRVAAACKKLGLKQVTLRAKEKLSASDVQQQARLLRYRLMAQWCARHKAEALVLAHHQDDQAETVLMRLARGSGVNGLSGMAEKQILSTPAGDLVLLRPFLTWRGSDLKRLAEKSGLLAEQDPSNHDRQFERVRWRQALPKLAEAGLSVEALSALAETMREVRTTLDAQLLTWLETHATWHEYGVLCLPRAPYTRLGDASRTRLMAAFVRYFGAHAHPLKRAQMHAFAARPLDSASGGATLGGAQMRWRQKTVFIGRELAACPAPMPIGSQASLWDHRWLLKSREKGLFVAPLGQAGLQGLRDGAEKNSGQRTLDKALPACYAAALPAFFKGERWMACPTIAPKTGFSATQLAAEGLFLRILRGGQHW